MASWAAFLAPLNPHSSAPQLSLGPCSLLSSLSLPPPPRAGAPMTGELQCRCLQTHAGLIPPKRIANVELIPEGPHCGVPEVIATLRDGREVCLEPTAPWVKMIVTKILNSSGRGLT
uniref:Chemokine interleukin-8-like domain-containing protein n=1 Tax=Terrapene triunguis TaxID=2587831 RepID=A0A674IZV7_9SAUR